MILLIYDAQILSRPCYTHVEKAPRFSHRPVTLFVTPVRDIAIVDTKQDDSIELSALGAVEGAQGYEASPVDPAREDIEWYITVLDRIGSRHHLEANLPFLVGVACNGLPWCDQLAAKAKQPSMGCLTRINAAAQECHQLA